MLRAGNLFTFSCTDLKCRFPPLSHLWYSFCSYFTSCLLLSTPRPKNRPPSPAAPKSRPLSPLVPATGAAKTPSGKKTPPPPGIKTRPKRAQTPARVQPQAVSAVTVETGHGPQQPDTSEEKKSECGYHTDDVCGFKVTWRFWLTFTKQ